jgi:hypothetical protein
MTLSPSFVSSFIESHDQMCSMFIAGRNVRLPAVQHVLCVRSLFARSHFLRVCRHLVVVRLVTFALQSSSVRAVTKRIESDCSPENTSCKEMMFDVCVIMK